MSTPEPFGSVVDYSVTVTTPCNREHCEWLAGEVISGWFSAIAEDPELHAGFPTVPWCKFNEDQECAALTWSVTNAGDLRDAVAIFLAWIDGAPPPVIEAITHPRAEMSISTVDSTSGI